jgi:hypothetical protein
MCEDGRSLSCEGEEEQELFFFFVTDILPVFCDTGFEVLDIT